MRNLPNEIVIGRYHSLYVERDSMPEVLSVTASTEDGVAMAIEHKTLPVGGVQFHPESLMSLGGEVGLRIVENAFRLGVPAIGPSLRGACDEAIQPCLPILDCFAALAMTKR